MGSQQSCCQKSGSGSVQKVESASALFERQQSPEKYQWDIFFSHKQSQAQDAVQAIIFNLKQKEPDIKIWVDTDQVPTEQGMEDGVKGSSHFLFYCTDEIYASEYCKKELAWAVKYKKKILLLAETDARSGAPDIGLLRDRMPGNLKHVFDENVAIPFYRDPAHKDVCINKILRFLAGEAMTTMHGSGAGMPKNPIDVKIAAASSGFTEAGAAIDNAFRKLTHELGHKPTLVIANMTCNYDCKVVQERLQTQVGGNGAFLGCTSSAGVLVNQTWQSHSDTGLGLFGLYDPDGAYEVCHVSDVKDVRTACQQAYKNAGQDCLPDFIVLFPHPGVEEIVIPEIKEALGASVPVVGGSSADNSLEGNWRQMSSANKDVTDAGVAFCLCWPSVVVQAGFCSGFHPTGPTGKITKLHGKRHIATIDNEPAATVYNKWCANKFAEEMKEKEDSVILGPSTLTPLGLRNGTDADGEAMHVVIHPHLLIKKDMSFTTFKDVEEGDTLVSLASTRTGILARLAKVTRSIIESAPFKVEDVVGSYQIFCGGVMMCIKDDMPIVVEKLGEVLNWTPSMGACTFGEQGTFHDGTPGHGNLMFASVIFSRIRKTSAKRGATFGAEQ